ncbi:MAG TPA: autotransporter domain-containing protein [Rhizomicrobium sp.]|jgi:outer membrane autotransporter protein|nr:autotransporter domain-containing protein [Rhizomicrobium sp.]
MKSSVYRRIACRVACAATLSAAPFLAVPALAGDTAWTPGSTDWFAAGNWSNGVPGAATGTTTVLSAVNAVIAGGAANAGATLTIGGAPVGNPATDLSVVEVQSGASLTVGTIDIGVDGKLVLDAGASLAAGAQLTGDGGELDLNGNATTLGALSGSTSILLGGATLTLDQSVATTFGGSIDGTGRLVVGGGGMLALTNAANTYSGGTLVRGGGTLIVSDDAALGEVHGSVTLGDATTSGTLRIGDDVDFAATRALVLGGAATIDTGGHFATQSGGIGGSGALTVTGAGTLTLEAVNTYTGATMVDHGTLNVVGSIATSSGVTVNAGATLAGTGTVGATTVAAGGRIDPGIGAGLLNIGGIGTLHVAGAFTTSGAYQVDATSAAADSLVVSGAAAVGGTLTVFVSGQQPAAGTEFTVLSAAGGVTGTFQLSNGAALGTVGPRLRYDANDVFLDFALATLSEILPAGASPNAAAVTHAIDAGMVANASPQSFAALGTLSPAALAASTSELTGEIGTALPNVSAAQANTFLTLLMNQPGDLDTDLGTGRAARSSGAYAFDNPAGSLAAPLPAAARDGPLGASAWLTVFGRHSSIDGDAAVGSHDTKDTTSGVAGGLDVLLGRGFVAGVAVAGGQTDFSVSDKLGAGRASTIEAGLYATKRFGRFYLSGAGAYDLQDVKTKRVIVNVGAGVLIAKVRARGYSGRVETGYRFGGAGLGMTPYLAVQASAFRTPAYAETAVSGSSDFALAYGAQSATAQRLEAGVGLDSSGALSAHTTLHLYGRVAYAHDTGGNNAMHVAFEALPGSDFTVQGAVPGANSGLLSLGAELRGQNGLALGMKFDGAASQHAGAYFGSFDLRYSW